MAPPRVYTEEQKQRRNETQKIRRKKKAAEEAKKAAEEAAEKVAKKEYAAERKRLSSKKSKLKSKGLDLSEIEQALEQQKRDRDSIVAAKASAIMSNNDTHEETPGPPTPVETQLVGASTPLSDSKLAFLSQERQREHEMNVATQSSLQEICQGIMEICQGIMAVHKTSTAQSREFTLRVLGEESAQLVARHGASTPLSDSKLAFLKREREREHEMNMATQRSLQEICQGIMAVHKTSTAQSREFTLRVLGYVGAGDGQPKQDGGDGDGQPKSDFG